MENGSNQLQLKVDGNGDGDYADVLNDDKTVSYGFDKNSLVIDAQLGGGHDSFDYSVTSDWSGAARTFLVNLGLGNDTFTITHGDTDVLNHSRVNIDVIGSL